MIFCAFFKMCEMVLQGDGGGLDPLFFFYFNPSLILSSIWLSAVGVNSHVHVFFNSIQQLLVGFRTEVFFFDRWFLL